MSGAELDVDPEVYWQEDARNERDEWEQHLRAVEEDDRDHRNRDAGERAA